MQAGASESMEAQFAPKLPDSCSRKEGGSRIPKVHFLEKRRHRDVSKWTFVSG